MEHKDMTYLLSSRLGGELVGRGSGLDAEVDGAGDPRDRAALPGDAASTLNAAQLEAVIATEGYVRVSAGAGTGKTRALTERFAYLVNDLGIMPGNILCVTFTNKAANEMRHRIRALTGDNDTGFINTFHGFCVSVLCKRIRMPFNIRRAFSCSTTPISIRCFKPSTTSGGSRCVI